MHIVTLSFDDGFLSATQRIAEIYERHGLAACFNVIATGHRPDFVPPDPYQVGIPKGDFALWNKLQARGHEIMPHGYRHANKAQLPLAEAQDLTRHCLEIFSAELDGFNPAQAVYNFPYNDSTPALEAWFPSVVKAFRTAGPSLNPLPHTGQVRLTCGAFGPENCEADLEHEISALLAAPEGWLIYNLHGLEDQGWGPIRAQYLDDLLARLTTIDTVRVLPAGRALGLAA